ncbi:cysteine-rich receptor-like protein kinase [Trifolium pratense]|uniref:Cysteine-rich receptor-like protein kinase n=1 Tax=Trifolium pratense TaxID=57577 RepID=A0A2K3NQ59_TRIPR|nr:cysteine-rich receptor-like protein kinase [Trifolium pratense]
MKAICAPDNLFLLTGANHPLLGATLAAAIAVAVQLVAPPLTPNPSRLFDLAENKSSIVAEMYALGWEAGGAAWVPDLWQWQPNPVRGNSVSDAYQLLTSQHTITLEAVDELIWHKQVPLKVSIFAWRLL